VIENKLQVMLNKPVSQDRDKQIKQIYIMLIRKYNVKGEREKLAEKIYELYDFDPQDGNSLYIIRRICKKNSLYEDMKNIESLNNEHKNTFWSSLSFSESLIKANAMGEARNVINNTKSLSYSYHHNFEVEARYIKLAIEENNT